MSRPRTELIIDAAIAVLGRNGARGLTHRDVDAAANLPSGSTSNYFRTREALVAAVVKGVAEREWATWEEVAGAVRPTTPMGLAEALAAFAVGATGPHRTLTLARYAIFIEAALHPELQEQLTITTNDLRRLATEWLRAVGSSHPERDAQIVFDSLDGLLLHQIVIPNPDFDPQPRLTALVEALVRK